MDRGGNMENEQVNPEGVAVGQEEAASHYTVAGDGAPDLPGETLEEAYSRILANHEYALQGMGETLMMLLGRVAAIEDFLRGEPKGE